MIQLQAPIPPTPDGTNVTGKTIIITGGNSGLGFEAARQFLLLGASRVILACRSMDRGREAVAALKSDLEVQKTNASALVEAFELDLDDYQSGLRFANKVKQDVKELDILLNNGGVVLMGYQKSKSGHERTMQVNCYTHLLLCLELFPLLRATAALRSSPTRITFVGSAMQKQETFSREVFSSSRTILNYLDDEAKYNKARYNNSKLAVNAYVRVLARIAPKEVVVNNLCPGLVQTNLDSSLPVVLRVAMQLVRKTVARTVQEGGRTLIHAAVVAGADTSGKFLRNEKVDPGAAFLNTPKGQEFLERFWMETVQDLAAVDPGLATFQQTVS